jgi:hypothetical protein
MVNPRKIECFEIENDEELNSLIHEVVEEGEDNYILPTKRKTSQNITRTSLVNNQRGGGSSRVSRVLAFILVGIVLLFATDSVEIKLTNKGEYHDGDVEQREDITDNPLLQYQPVVNEEAAIDVEAEAAGESVGSEEEKAKDKIPMENDNHHSDSETETDGPTPNDNKDGSNVADTIQEKTDDMSPTSSTRFYKYTRRGQPIDEVERQRLADQWGSWTLVDPLLDQRPKNDFYAAYPNRDIPRTELPTNAWQLDTDYVGKFLDEGLALVNRAMEGILSEYGHGREDEPNVEFETRSEMFRFHLIEGNLTNNNDSIDGAKQRGGWTTARSWLNLKKRVLHSIMAQDSFIFAMGGHSAAAGHGYVAKSLCMRLAGVVLMKKFCTTQNLGRILFLGGKF